MAPVLAEQVRPVYEHCTAWGMLYDFAVTSLRNGVRFLRTGRQEVDEIALPRGSFHVSFAVQRAGKNRVPVHWGFRDSVRFLFFLYKRCKNRKTSCLLDRHLTIGFSLSLYLIATGA